MRWPWLRSALAPLFTVNASYAPAVRYDHNAAREKFFSSAGVGKPAPVVAAIEVVTRSPEQHEVPKGEESDMSFFSTIANAEHSTIAWLEKELTAFEGKAPTIERVIDAGLTYVGPVLQIGLTAMGDAPEAALVGVVIGKAQVDLKAASALVTDFGPTPTAASMFSAVSSDLGSLLSAAQVKNTTTIATVTKAVNEVGMLGSAVQLAATQITAAAK
jgi:hypothetical protein